MPDGARAVGGAATVPLRCLDADVYDRFARSASSFLVDVASCAR
jgi:hypothetical protein